MVRSFFDAAAIAGQPARVYNRLFYLMGAMERASVLIIDNEPALLDVLADNLQHKGFKVYVAADGERGLALLERERPDVVLLDLRMPRLDGFAVLREIRRIQPALPVLVMSADESPETAEKALGAGANDFVAKPIDLDELERSLVEIEAIAKGRRSAVAWKRTR